MTKNQKTVAYMVLIVFGAALILGVAAYTARGWLRDDFMSSVIDVVYADGVERQFEKDFAAVNPRLRELGLTFELSLSQGRKICGVSGYEFISATYACTRGMWTEKLDPNSEFTTNWQQQSPAFEKYLLSAGWKKTWNERQPIDELFRERQENTSIGVNYVKTHGKVSCELSIWVNPATDDAYYGHTPAKLMASQGCARYIDVLGGY